LIDNFSFSLSIYFSTCTTKAVYNQASMIYVIMIDIIISSSYDTYVYL